VQSVQIEVVDLDVPEASLREARRLLSDKETKRSARFLRDEDRTRFVAARSFLRRTLGKQLGIPAEKVEFAYGAHGKPGLAAPFSASDLRFNLSHSAGRAVLAWTKGREVGVDLEKLRSVKYGVKISQRYFTDEERAVFDGIDGPAWDEAFFRCWTRKEAFIKAVGNGLSYPLRSFSVPTGATVAEAPVHVHADGPEIRWLASSIDVGPGFLGAFVVAR
jgi:4'-phosphopantetheinyl transferase